MNPAAWPPGRIKAAVAAVLGAVVIVAQTAWPTAQWAHTVVAAAAALMAYMHMSPAAARDAYPPAARDASPRHPRDGSAAPGA